jgi:hypothetical protein
MTTPVSPWITGAVSAMIRVYLGQFLDEEHLGQDHRLDLCRVDALVGRVDAG